MAKVNKTALHDFVTGEFVKEEHLDQSFEVLRVAINDTDARVDALTQDVSQVENHADSLQTSLNNLTASHNNLSQQFSNYQVQVNQQFIDVQAQFDQQIANLDAQFDQELAAVVSQFNRQLSNLDTEINQRITDLDTLTSQQITDLQLQYTYLEDNKADTSYVEQLVANVQAGQLVPGTIKTEHIADGSITAEKVDGVSVLTAQQVNERIAQIRFSWDDVLGKPSVFPPEPHIHTWNDVQDKPSQFTPAPHTHQGSDIQGAVSDSQKLGGYAASNYPRLNVVNTFTQRQIFAAGVQLGDANADVIDVMGLVVPLNTHTRQVTAWDSTFPEKPKTIQIKDGSTVMATIEVLARNSEGRVTQLMITQGARTRTWNLTWTAGKEWPDSITVS